MYCDIVETGYGYSELLKIRVQHHACTQEVIATKCLHNLLCSDCSHGSPGQLPVTVWGHNQNLAAVVRNPAL